LILPNGGKTLMLSSPSAAVAPPARRARLGPHLVLGTIVALGLALLWWARGGWVFPLDDAYITLHNARVLIEGRDPNYGVSALVGATSLLHLALVTAFGLVLPGEAASYLVAAAGLVLFLTGLLTLARRMGLRWPESVALALVGPMSGATQFLNGLETGLVMAAVTWLLVLALNGPSRRLALACGLLPFLRPELGLLSLALMARQAWHRLAAGPDRAAALRAIAADAAMALTAATPWLAWSFVETGTVLPQTMAAKQAFFGSSSLGQPTALALAAFLILAGLGPVAVALPFLGRDTLALALWSFVALFALGFGLTAPSLLAHNEHRYTFALLPVALFALMRLGALRGPRLLHLVVLAQGVMGVVHPPDITAGQKRVAQYQGIARWAQANLPPQARVLIHDAGVIAYTSDLPLTDLVGLKSPGSVADHRRWTAPSGGAERFRAVDAIAQREHATHAIILDDAPDRFWGTLADDLRRAGWRLDPPDTAVANSPYTLYRLTPPDGPIPDP